ncbi:MAG: hypothetical protein FJ217_10300 [Ignavibacteria bacterium]|nr:hypothetical protein [Ignavibacteria bacterium]
MIRKSTDRAANVTTYECEGRLSAEEIIEAVQALYEGVPTHYVLWDLSSADTSGFRSDDIQGIASFVKRQAHSRVGGKTAIVAAGDLSFGLSRIYEAYAAMEGQQAEVRTFRSLEEARQWLKV